MLTLFAVFGVLGLGFPALFVMGPNATMFRTMGSLFVFYGASELFMPAQATLILNWILKLFFGID